MSGGSLDYVSFRVDDAADSIASRCEDALHQAFAAHLRLVAKALHDCEWMLSCDTGPGDDDAAIRAVIAPGSELAAALQRCTAASLALAPLLAAPRTGEQEP